MNKTTEFFEKNGYIVLKDAISPSQGAELTKYMFDLHSQGKLVKDDQCPLSDAVYGDPVFDSILEKFAKPIGDSIGRTLLPTYSYARIYRSGEILEKHRDRPSCEISATMTLGFDSKPIWPIIFDEQKETSVSLEVGEMAVYKGCDVLHWRTEFKGKWHVQVFLHYVDANGPFADHVRDGRQSLGFEKGRSNKPSQPTDESIKIPKPIFNAMVIPNLDNLFPGYFCIDSQNLPELKFTNEECDAIIALTTSNYPTTASIGGNEDTRKIVKNIRSANIFNIENNQKNQWIYEKIAKIISVANILHFNYEIVGITHEIQLIEYSTDLETPGHYDWHVDTGNGGPVHRKISFTAQLSDPADYKGCELVINNHAVEVVGTKERGSIHLFPSYMPHKVNPITSGVRYALVIWINGSQKFR